MSFGDKNKRWAPLLVAPIYDRESCHVSAPSVRLLHLPMQPVYTVYSDRKSRSTLLPAVGLYGSGPALLVARHHVLDRLGERHLRRALLMNNDIRRGLANFDAL
jgi:hypothetical protein